MAEEGGSPLFSPSNALTVVEDGETHGLVAYGKRAYLHQEGVLVEIEEEVDKRVY